MTDMIEVVARAICDADVTAPPPDAKIYVAMQPGVAWEARVEMATAVIEALMEPTEEMLARGSMFCGQEIGSHVIGARDDAHDIYQAMLRTALEGE